MDEWYANLVCKCSSFVCNFVFVGNGLISPVNNAVAPGAFVTDSNFSSVFGNTDNKSKK